MSRLKALHKSNLTHGGETSHASHCTRMHGHLVKQSIVFGSRLPDSPTITTISRLVSIQCIGDLHSHRNKRLRPVIVCENGYHQFQTQTLSKGASGSAVDTPAVCTSVVSAFKHSFSVITLVFTRVSSTCSHVFLQLDRHGVGTRGRSGASEKDRPGRIAFYDGGI